MRTIVKSFLLVLVLFTCLLPSGCVPDPERHEGDVIMEVAIFPAGTGEESYYFIVNQNGELNCFKGARQIDEMDINRFYRRIDQQEEKQLSEAELQCLLDYAEILRASGYSYDRIGAEDSWHYTVLYNDTIYEMDRMDNEPELLRKVIEEIIRLSPIPVDLHGWA